MAPHWQNRYIRDAGCDPSAVGIHVARDPATSGVAALNRRLMAWTPPGSGFRDALAEKKQKGAKRPLGDSRLAGSVFSWLLRGEICFITQWLRV